MCLSLDFTSFKIATLFENFCRMSHRLSVAMGNKKGTCCDRQPMRISFDSCIGEWYNSISLIEYYKKRDPCCNMNPSNNRIRTYQAVIDSSITKRLGKINVASGVVLDALFLPSEAL